LNSDRQALVLKIENDEEVACNTEWADPEYFT